MAFCAHCKKKFSAKRHGRYCKTSCRVLAYRDRKSAALRASKLEPFDFETDLTPVSDDELLEVQGEEVTKNGN
jgi:hypothetical protein